MKRRLKIKPIIILAILTFLMTLMVSCSENKLESFEKDGVTLSKLTKEEGIRFIEDKGIDIPESIEDVGEFIKDMIEATEEDSENIKPYIYSHTDTAKFAEDIKDIVNKYYGK